MDDLLSLRDAAVYLGVPYEKLKTMARRGAVPSHNVQRGRRTYLHIRKQDLDALKANQGPSYETLWQQYLTELAAGTIGTKPASAKWVNESRLFMEAYWRHLGQAPSIEGVSADNYRQVVLAIGIDDAVKNDHHSKKLNIYKVVTGFMRLLVREGYKKPADREAFQKPKQKFQPVRNHIEPDVVTGAIEFNQMWRNGRASHDVAVMDVLMHLYAFAGLRRAEACELKLDDVDLGQNMMTLWGKGGKQARLPIVPELMATLTRYLGQRPSGSAYVVVQADGSPLSISGINSRFKRLSRAYGHPVRPHDLRRACANLLLDKGVHPTLIQAMMRHSDQETTQIYLNPSERRLREAVGKAFSPALEPVAKPEAKETDWYQMW